MPRFAGVLRSAIWKILPLRKYIRVSGSVIPSPDRRRCGLEFKDDTYYLESAEGEANRLINHFQCTQESRVLDVGCGQGRLPIGLLRTIGDINYLGLDVDRRSIDWCRKYIEQYHPNFHFKYLNIYNKRYNRSGIKIDGNFRFDIKPRSVDIIYLFSVFSHTTEEDMRIYLRDFYRILDDKGKVFFTAFVEEDVPNISINPKNYRLRTFRALHIVRYRKDYLFSILRQYGYSIINFTYGTETDGQSAIYLSKNSSG